jgi:cyclophilin family peptidyl-prolyl cis-trans isomerase/HEAT repeat protein
VRRALIVVLLAGCDCSGSASPDAGSGREPAPPTGGAEPAELLQVADSRQLGAPLRSGLGSGDVAVRRAAALALARLHDPEAVPLLLAAVRDSDAQVRLHAALGLGGLEDDAPAEVAAALLGAVAAEPPGPGRAEMLWDLGRVADETAFPAFRRGLADEVPAVRAGACRGLGALGLRDQAIPGELGRLVATRMVDDPSGEVRLACSYALTRLAPDPAPEVAQAVVADLARAAADENAEVRTMAVRALGRYPLAPIELLEERTADPDWRVAVYAFRALAQLSRVSDEAFARALRRRLDRALGTGAELAGPEAHVLLAAFAAGEPLAGSESTRGVAEEAHERLGQVEEGSASRDRALAHCAAAALADRGRGWPTLIRQCGLSQVAAPAREARAAELLGHISGSDRERARELVALYRGAATSRVREAVLGAIPSVPPPNDGELIEVLLAALQGGDSGTIAAAADALVQLAARWRPLDDRGRPADIPPTVRAGLLAPMRAAQTSLAEENELEGLQSWLAAAKALGLTELREQIVGLLGHFNLSVRKAAATCLEGLGIEQPSEPVSWPGSPNPLPIATFAAAPAMQAIIETSRGEIRIELSRPEAPGTVARFVELARAGFYDGLMFHRVVPAFVIQGGDPRGDGYGGPGWSQRCEDNRIRYERGTLGMALAGRDTGGSQFFITHGAQPHLDGRYTAFGHVTAGIEVVEAIQEGDVIRTLRVLDPAPQ